MSGSVPGAIQPIAPYQPPDIAGMAGQYAGLQNQLLSNQAQQQQLNAKVAIGQAYSQAIDPQTGMIDTNKLMQAVAANPNASYMAGDVAQQAQSRQEEQYKLNQDQLAQTSNRLGVYKSAMAPLLALGNNVTPGAIFSTVKGLAAAGMPTDEITGDMAATMPTMDPAHANDPGYQAAYGQALHSWLQNQWGGNLSGETQANVFRPNLQQVNTGGQITLQDVNPTTNPGGVNAQLTNTPTPEFEMTQTVIGHRANGTAIYGTQSQLQQEEGAGGAQGGGSSSFGPNNGRYNAPAPSAANGGAPTGAAPGTGPVPGGGAVIDQPPGTTTAQAAATTDGQTQLLAIRDAGTGVSQQQGILSDMLGPLSSQALTTGPGSDEIRQFTARVNATLGTNINTAGVAAGEGFNKLSQGLANAQVSSLGAGTNEKLEASMAVTPNSHISTDGNIQIIHKLQGNADFLAARSALAGTYLQAHPGDLSGFNASTANLDPRFFQMNRMSPEEQKGFLNELPYSQYHYDPQTKSYAGSFVSGYNQAAASGLFANAPSGANAPAPAAPQVPIAP